MPVKSAGILAFRRKDHIEVYLVHPGGPFWAKKDLGAWSIPKGEFTEDDDPLEAAKREFEEETGQEINGDFILLTPCRQKSGKMIHAWAVEAEPAGGALNSNYFELEWPPKSGKKQSFPEVDKGEWFTVDEALKKIIPGQAPFIHELEKVLDK